MGGKVPLLIYYKIKPGMNKCEFGDENTKFGSQ